MNELKAWLAEHAEHLKGYTLDEKADLAIAAGFDRKVVADYQVQTRFRQAA